MARILFLNPWHGGSHKQVADEWQRWSRHQIEICGLPARHWKWRMRHAAWTFAQELRERQQRGEHFDAICCTDMLDAATFRALAGRAALGDIPIILYVHEHQAGYPDPRGKDRDQHFALTNLTSVVAADAVWFNSAYQRQEFAANHQQLLKQLPDYRDTDWWLPAWELSRVQWPGWDLAEHTPRPRAAKAPLHILWAARWQADKAPERFTRVLTQLLDEGHDMMVSMVGGHRGHTHHHPFADLPQRLGERLQHFGFLPQRADYEDALHSADVVVSTAEHEFFGISMVEAAAAGCLPCLPRSLAYPEVFARLEPNLSDLVFYDGSEQQLLQRLRQHCQEPPARGQACAAVAHLHWQQRAEAMDAGVDALLGR